MSKLTRSSRFAKRKLKLKDSNLLSKLPFIKKDAMRAMPMDYYKAQFQNLKNTAFIETEKKRLGTPKWGYVTDLLLNYKHRGYNEQSITGKILTKIFEKNKEIALGTRPFCKTQNVLSVIARQETLIIAYGRVKRNQGALTRAANISASVKNNMNSQANKLYYRTRLAPDGICLKDFYLASFLILKGTYPWGSSKRVWLDKPGSNKKRPITIPPFMDKVVQEAIKMVLHAIWEPEFEIMNKSFGFRPNKSCGDAITAITSTKSQGLSLAIEGDIQGAYDSVPKDRLLKQISEKIDDNNFLKFLKKRLNYDYVDESGRHRPILGIPQGGIDSPYLFNIHLLALDRYIHDPINGLQAYINKLNEKIKVKKYGHRYKPRDQAKRQRGKLENLLNIWRHRLKNDSLRIDEIYKLRQERYATIAKIKKFKHKLLKMPFYEPSAHKIRIFYVRYADDWIIFSNSDAQICTKMKYLIKNFLYNDLGATLSDEKTIITNMRIKAAHFLGYELRQLKGRAMYDTIKGRKSLVSSPGLLIKAYPDRQRLINRLHSKGFCEIDGFPKSVPWLSNLKTFIIIERFNASMRGLMIYYSEFVAYKSTLVRWHYILQLSCFKTIAQKYKISISKVFKRFGKNFGTKHKTISSKVEVTVNGITYEKEWSLLTFEQVYDEAISIKQKNELKSRFWSREKKQIGGYPLNKDRPSITQDSFLDYINWTSLRRQASLNMPCLICGSKNNVEMHHIRHIRKNPYNKLQQKAFLQIMQLRNRKQTPVCRNCHRKVIHTGIYSGKKLNNLINYDQTLFDNRVLHSESYVNSSNIEYFGKTLVEKGFSEKNPSTWVKETEFDEHPES